MFVLYLQGARQKVIDNAARELEERMNAIEKREDKEVGSKALSTSCKIARGCLSYVYRRRIDRYRSKQMDIELALEHFHMDIERVE